jgi:hypothetical protein
MDNPQPSPKVIYYLKLNYYGCSSQTKCWWGTLINKLSILRYSRALGEIQVFEQSYIIKELFSSYTENIII